MATVFEVYISFAKGDYDNDFSEAITLTDEEVERLIKDQMTDEDLDDEGLIVNYVRVQRRWEE